MNAEYKGYTIVATAEHDDSTHLWNGRYRILDSNGIVAYESFTTSLNDEGMAQEAANEEARAWIDSDKAQLSGTPE
ncbi:MAG: hypothetical protein ABJA60_02005 [Nitrosospira sp.]